MPKKKPTTSRAVLATFERALRAALNTPPQKPRAAVRNKKTKKAR